MLFRRRYRQMLSRCTAGLCFLIVMAKPAVPEEAHDRPAVHHERKAVQVFIGVGEGLGRVRRGGWMPVTYRINNRSAMRVEGTLTLTSPVYRSGKAPENLTIQRVPLAIPASSDRVGECYVKADKPVRKWMHVVSASDVDLKIDARPPFDCVARQTMLTLWPEECQVLVARSKPGRLAMRLRGDDSPGHQFAWASQSGIPPAARINPRVVASHPRYLPRSWVGYSSVDCLVWDGISYEELSPGQARALDNYVKAGGHLIVFSGDRWPQLREGLLRELLPVDGLRSEVIEDELLVKWLEEATVGDVQPERKDRQRVRIELCRGDLKPGAQVLLWWRQKPLVVSHRAGAGTVTFLAFSSGDPLGKVLTNSNQMWRRLVRFSSLLASKGDPPEWSGRIASELGGSLGRRVIPKRSISLFLLVYLLAMGGNCILFRRLGRPLYAWASGVLLASLFAFAAYRSDTLGGGTQLHLVHFVQTVPGSEVAEVKSYISLFSPVSTGYQVEFTRGEFFYSYLDQELNLQKGSFITQTPRKRMLLEHGATQRIARLEASARSQEIFQAAGLIKLSPELVAQIEACRQLSPEEVKERIPEMYRSLAEQGPVSVAKLQSGPFLPLKVNGRIVTSAREITFIGFPKGSNWLRSK